MRMVYSLMLCIRNTRKVEYPNYLLCRRECERWKSTGLANCGTEGIFDGTQNGKTGPTVYVASTDVKDNLVSSNDLQENTDEMWDNNLNPSQIIVNASAGRSSSTRVMMLIPRPVIEYSVSA